jgi:hypothetical protein
MWWQESNTHLFAAYRGSRRDISSNIFITVVVQKESHAGVYAKVKYAGIKIGEALEGPVHYLDMNYLVYPEVSTVRSCLEHYHFKLNSDKFNECYRVLG